MLPLEHLKCSLSSSSEGRHSDSTPAKVNLVKWTGIPIPSLPPTPILWVHVSLLDWVLNLLYLSLLQKKVIPVKQNHRDFKMISITCFSKIIAKQQKISSVAETT